MDAFLKVRMTLDFYQFGVQQSDLLSDHEYFQKYEPQIPNIEMDSQRKDIIKPRIYRSVEVGKSVTILKEMQDTKS